MGVYEGRGQIGKAHKMLMAQWMETRMSWDDVMSRIFEEKYLRVLESDLKSAVSAMDQMAIALTAIHRDCE